MSGGPLSIRAHYKKMNKPPIDVRCPTCLARPGNACRSVKSWIQGIDHGQGTIMAVVHRARKLRAKKSDFKAVE